MKYVALINAETTRRELLSLQESSKSDIRVVTDSETLAADIVGACQDFLASGNAHRYKTLNDALQTVYNRVTSTEKLERISSRIRTLK